MSTTAQTHQQDLERLKSLRYMDDDFMTVCLADNFEGVELILRIVLGRENIKIKSVRTQDPIDAHILKSGDDTENIPDSYVIFITENDVMKGNQPMYPVERYVTIGKNKVLFGDGSYILYVNGKYRGNDEIDKLMHDFSCTDPDDMNYEALAKKARYFKKDTKGVATMCKIMEDMRNEAALYNARETAERMIKKVK